MRQVSLVTDSTAGISPELAAELGVVLVSASYAFDEERFLDSETDWREFYSRLSREEGTPRTFGVAEPSWRTAFEDGLETTGAVVALVTPFDVSPSFTTAVAAMLAIQADQPDAPIKVVNAGTAAAGLGALVTTLAALTNAGADLEEIVSVMDELEPVCDSLFVPRSAAWLERAGLALLEEKLGPLDGKVPLVRVGTRIMGVTLAEGQDEGIASAVELAGKRAPNARAFNGSVVHADAAEGAADAASRLRRRWPMDSITVANLSATYGVHLGPGTIGVGVCPVPEGMD